jgi:hypothetical protein
MQVVKVVKVVTVVKVVEIVCAPKNKKQRRNLTYSFNQKKAQQQLHQLQLLKKDIDCIFPIAIVPLLVLPIIFCFFLSLIHTQLPVFDHVHVHNMVYHIRDHALCPF